MNGHSEPGETGGGWQELRAKLHGIDPYDHGYEISRQLEEAKDLLQVLEKRHREQT